MNPQIARELLNEYFLRIRTITRISLTTILTFFIVSFNQSYCQSLTSNQRRIVNEALLNVINDYENYSRFTTDNKSISENYISQFSDLFDKNASLYLDILPSNKVSDAVNLTQYISIFKKYYSNGIGVKLHNILFDMPVYLTDGYYKINVELDKEIYGYNKTKVNYRDTIPLVFNIGFKASGNNISDVKILGITGERRGRFLKFRIFKFLTLKPVENAEIKLDSKLSRTNKQGMANIEDINPDKKHILTISSEPYKRIVYSNLDIDEYIEGNTSKKQERLKYDYYDPNEFIFFMNTLNFTLTPVVSFNIPGLKTVVSEGRNNELELDNLRERGSFSPRVGIRFGITLFRTNNIDFSINAGFEKNFIRAAYLFDTCHIENLVVDPVHGLYIRSDDLYDFKQKITLNFTDFPLFISVNYKHFRDIDIGANFGIRFTNLNKSTSKIKTGFSSIIAFDTINTVKTKNYNGFVSETRFLTYQLGFSICKEIRPSVKIYAGPTFFFYNKKFLKNEVVLEDIISPDGEINNLLHTYKSSKIQCIALEFGVIYNFNSLNLKKIL